MPKPLTPSFRALGHVVAEVYPSLERGRLLAELRRLNQITDDARTLVGKTILDIGCGSADSQDGPRGRANRLFCMIFKPHLLEKFEPWYCRIAHEARANVIGLDIADVNGEPFETRKADVLAADAFSSFADGSVDAVNNYHCTVPRDGGKAATGTSPAIMTRLDMHFEEAFRADERVLHEVERMLKTGGTYTHSERVYRKDKGGLKLVHVMDGLGS